MEHISKSMDDKIVLKDISFNIRKGEIVGFVGPNGAGKTTTIKTMVGLLTPDSGEIIINGINVKNKKDIVRSLEGISCIIENPAVYKNMTAKENLEQFMRTGENISKKDVEDIIKFVGLEGNEKKKVKNYSLGMKQRLAIGQALITHPKLLILDEPTNGLDPTGIMEIRELLHEISRKEGISIFISSHILDELEKLCDRIIFIKNGEIMKQEISKESRESTKNQLYVIVPKEIEITKEKIRNVSNVTFVKNHEKGFIVKIPENSVSEFIFYLSNQKIALKEIYEYKETLEERYKEVYQ